MSTRLVPIPADLIATPWGIAELAIEFGPGVILTKTQSHGGYYLRPEQWARVKALWPAWRPFQNIPPWLEEDQDAVIAVLAFPEYFADPDIFNAVRCVLSSEFRAGEIDRGWVQVATWLNEDPAGRALKARADAFGLSIADRWERGGLSGGGGRPGWQVHLYRGGEHRTLCFKQYPEQQFYSDAELSSLVYTEQELAIETAHKTWRKNPTVDPAPDEGDYSGVFDGFQVTSDADPGL